MIIQQGGFTDLSPFVLYGILRLRSEVFVVEQNCVYLDPDGRDPEPDARHVWAEADEKIVGYLRVVTDPDATARIGRVCVSPSWRGRGLASELLAAALEHIGDRPVRLNAQTSALTLYAAQGFAPAGEEFLEDGIPHVPMVRPAGQETEEAAGQEAEQTITAPDAGTEEHHPAPDAAHAARPDAAAPTPGTAADHVAPPGATPDQAAPLAELRTRGRARLRRRAAAAQGSARQAQ